MSLFKREPVWMATILGLLIEGGTAVNLVTAHQLSAIHAGGLGAIVALAQVAGAIVVREHVFAPATVATLQSDLAAAGKTITAWATLAAQHQGTINSLQTPVAPTQGATP
jgi:pantoate kinase